jgi:hypothetical protein
LFIIRIVRRKQARTPRRAIRSNIINAGMNDDAHSFFRVQ